MDWMRFGSVLVSGLELVAASSADTDNGAPAELRATVATPACKMSLLFIKNSKIASRII
jgi:hypothetical protein